MFFFKVKERLIKKIGKCTSCAIYFANTGKKIFYCTTGTVEYILKKNDKFKKGFGYMFEEKIQEKYRIPNMV